MISVLHLERSDDSINIIYSFLRVNEYLLPDPLSSYVDLFEYSKKLNDLGDTFIIRDHSSVRGLVSGYINDFVNKKAFLQILIVEKESQGKKYGSLLVSAFLDYSKDKRMKEVYLTVDKLNKSAYNKYIHLGFKESSIHLENPKKMQLVFRIQ